MEEQARHAIGKYLVKEFSLIKSQPHNTSVVNAKSLEKMNVV